MGTSKTHHWSGCDYDFANFDQNCLKDYAHRTNRPLKPIIFAQFIQNYNANNMFLHRRFEEHERNFIAKWSRDVLIPFSSSLGGH